MFNNLLKKYQRETLMIGIAQSKRYLLNNFLGLQNIIILKVDAILIISILNKKVNK